MQLSVIGERTFRGSFAAKSTEMANFVADNDRTANVWPPYVIFFSH